MIPILEIAKIHKPKHSQNQNDKEGYSPGKESKVFLRCWYYDIS